MKRPSISFNKEAIIDFFLNHAEKIVVALVAALACGMVWGGINAARTKPAAKDHLPSAIASQAEGTASHIQSAKHPPAEAVKDSQLVKLIDPWRAPELVGPPPVAMLNKPLFEEKSRRTKPMVFPVEDLRAVAGVVLLPLKENAAGVGGRNPIDVDMPLKPTKPPKRVRGRQAGPGGAENPNPNGLPPDAAAQFGAAQFGAGQQAQAARGRLVPYCIVTGLLPVAKQIGDYQQRFAEAGFRDPKRDQPLWSEYLVERSVVVPGGRESWEKIDMKTVLKRAQKEWSAVQGEQLPAGFLLAADQNPGAGAVGYCAPLPQLAGDAWGTESMHPWFVEQAKKFIADQAAAAKRAAEPVDSPAAGQNPLAEPDFQSPLNGPQPGMLPGGPGMALDAAGRPIVELEYKLFRFVDTTVEVGKSYRYRVRLSVWNPNYNLASQYLAEPALAKDAKLPSQPSNVTDPVTVPGTTSLVVRALRKAESKRFKPGMTEVLVLAEDNGSGSYSLRSLITEIGGLANIDNRLNRPAETRVRGAEITTNSLLVDMRGRQEDRAETRTNKPTPPPDPLEMLFLREDGTFELASAADAQLQINRFIGTLPFAEEQRTGRDRPEQAEPSPDNPFGNPFRSQ
jgi:hypothetical protein